MLSKRYESTEVDRRPWLHVPSGTHLSTSIDTHQVVSHQAFSIRLSLSLHQKIAKRHYYDRTVSYMYHWHTTT